LGQSVSGAVTEAGDLAQSIDRIFKGEKAENLSMDAMAWLQSDWGLRECRRLFADLKTKNVMAGKEMAQLKEELGGWAEEGDGADDEQELKTALDGTSVMLEKLTSALGVGTAAGSGLSASFKSFDDAMQKGVSSAGGFGTGRGSVEAGPATVGAPVEAIKAIEEILAEKVDKADFAASTSKVEARVDAVVTDLGTTNTQVNDQLAQIHATEEKAMDIQENLSKLKADVEHDKKNRGSAIERLVKKFVDTYVAKLGMSEGGGGGGDIDIEALGNLELKLVETASELRQEMSLRASITSLEEVKAELQKSIDKKADEAALKELEALLQKMLKDFSGLRKLLEKDTAVAISELERRLMEVIEERVRTGGTIGTLDGAATVKSLITGREIPEQPEKEYDFEQRKLLPRLASPSCGPGEVMRSGFRMPLHRPQTSGGEYGNYADLDSTSSMRSPGGGRGGGYSQDSASWINDPEFEAGMSVEDFRNNEDMSSVGSLTAPSDMAYGRGSQHITVPRVPPPSVNRMAGFSGIEGTRKGVSGKKSRRPMVNDTSSRLKAPGTSNYSPVRMKKLTSEANAMSQSDRLSLSKFDQEGL
jgi:hypothetical protein